VQANDTTVIRDAGIGGDLFIGIPLGFANDAGNDRVGIFTSTAASVSISPGDGHDVAEMVDVVAVESITTLMGAGNDIFGGNFEATEEVTVAMGAGSDVMFAGLTAGGVTIDLEAGNDLLQLFEVDQNNPTHTASINLGTGNDRATVGVGMGAVGFDSFLAVTGSAGKDQFYMYPGATLVNGMIVLEVESTAPYLAYMDPVARKQHSGVFRRAQEFGDFLTALP
jgi:hypothetical protein